MGIFAKIFYTMFNNIVQVLFKVIWVKLAIFYTWTVEIQTISTDSIVLTLLT